MMIILLESPCIVHVTNPMLIWHQGECVSPQWPPDKVAMPSRIVLDSRRFSTERSWAVCGLPKLST